MTFGKPRRGPCCGKIHRRSFLADIGFGFTGLALGAMLNRDGVVGTIVVEDNGCGIADENKPRLFMPFFTTKQDGMGLGLSICRSLIESLDGRITLIGRPESGAAFKVELPVTPEVSVLGAHDPEFGQRFVPDRDSAFPKVD